MNLVIPEENWGDRVPSRRDIESRSYVPRRVDSGDRHPSFLRLFKFSTPSVSTSAANELLMHDRGNVASVKRRRPSTTRKDFHMARPKMASFCHPPKSRPAFSETIKLHAGPRNRTSSTTRSRCQSAAAYQRLMKNSSESMAADER